MNKKKNCCLPQLFVSKRDRSKYVCVGIERCTANSEMFGVARLSSTSPEGTFSDKSLKLGNGGDVGRRFQSSTHCILPPADLRYFRGHV